MRDVAFEWRKHYSKNNKEEEIVFWIWLYIQALPLRHLKISVWNINKCVVILAARKNASTKIWVLSVLIQAVFQTYTHYAFMPCLSIRRSKCLGKCLEFLAKMVILMRNSVKLMNLALPHFHKPSSHQGWAEPSGRYGCSNAAFHIRLADLVRHLCTNDNPSKSTMLTGNG